VKSGGSATPPTFNAGAIPNTGNSDFTMDAKGQFYVASTATNQVPVGVTVFGAGSTGNATLVSQFALSPPTDGIYAMTTDAAGQLYVADVNYSANVFQTSAGYTQVSVFPAGAVTSNAAASYTISLPAEEAPVAVAVDGSGFIYIACDSFTPSFGIATGNTIPPPVGTIYVYAPGAANSFTPKRTITTTNAFAGMTVDAAGDVFAIEDTYTTAGNTNLYLVSSVAVAEFAAGATGAAPPVKTISGSGTVFSAPTSIQVDSAGNLYVLSGLSSNTLTGLVSSPSVLVFGPTATGNAPPAVSIAANGWTKPGIQMVVQ
jgi:hypothetical protein